MAKHRRDGEDAAPTEVIPVVGTPLPAEPDLDETATLTVVDRPRGGRTTSPLLLVSGAVALILVVVVGGWALVGARGDADPLVYPWNSQSPGRIDVSVSLEPTDLPSPSTLPSLSPSAVVRVSPRVSAAPSRSPSRSPESVSSPAAAATVSLDGFSRWRGGYVASFRVVNRATTPVRWTVVIDFADDLQVNEVWNATVDDRTGARMTFTAAQDLPAGQSVAFGFRASHEDDDEPYPVKCTIQGQIYACAPRT
ncbi:MAG: hypothetical protein HOV79_07460 [Hamadaea sp.]|nr:hypothetical protein [Hamadaea sp.]